MPLQHADPQAEGLQQPVPGRVPGHQPRHHRGERPRRGQPRDACTGKGLAHKGALVKVLGRGELTRKVTVKAHAFSKSAEAAITAAGGTVGGPAQALGRPASAGKGNQFTNR